MNKENRTPHWIPCPICKEKTDVKVFEDTETEMLINFQLLKNIEENNNIFDLYKYRVR